MFQFELRLNIVEFVLCAQQHWKGRREYSQAEPVHAYKGDVLTSNPTRRGVTFGFTKTCGESMSHINLPREYFMDTTGHKSVHDVNQAGNISLDTYNILLSNTYNFLPSFQMYACISTCISTKSPLARPISTLQRKTT